MSPNQNNKLKEKFWSKKDVNYYDNYMWLSTQFPLSSYYTFREEPHRDGVHNPLVSFSQKAMELPHEDFKRLFKLGEGKYYV